MVPRLISITLLLLPLTLPNQQVDENKPVQSLELKSNQDQLATTPTRHVLKNLHRNFEKLDSKMSDDEIFRALGLTQYQNHLHENSRIILDGAGGNWRYYINDDGGYSFAIRDFFGSVKCMIKLPGDKHWRKRDTNAKPIDLSIIDFNKPKAK
jgi:hypothetical protein